MTHLTYLQAAVVGLIQGISEMFPISSLGHNVLLPALIGGSWSRVLNVSGSTSPYLAFIVGLHVATALALLVFFWRDWVRIIGGFLSSLRRKRVETVDERLAWMIVLATIPVGLAGLLFQKEFRVIFGTPIYAGVFLAVNGIILIGGERLARRRAVAAHAARAADSPLAASRPAEDERLASAAQRPGMVTVGQPEHAGAAGPWADEEAAVPGGQPSFGPDGAVPGRRPAAQRPARPARPGAIGAAAAGADARAVDRRLAAIGYGQAVLIGSAQILALLAGISRDGVTMVAGMARGLSREDAARFAFLLATPVILAAGALKVPSLFGPQGKGIGGPILLGSVLAGLGAYFSVRILLRYLRTRSLAPFGVYCLLVGVGSVLYLGVIK